MKKKQKPEMTEAMRIARREKIKIALILIALAIGFMIFANAISSESTMNPADWGY